AMSIAGLRARSFIRLATERWPVVGGSPVRCGSTATSAQSIVKLGPESDLNGPGALARMTKLPADDTASPTRKMSSLQPVMLPLSMTEAILVLALATAIRDSPEIWLGISLNLGCPVHV